MNIEILLLIAANFIATQKGLSDNSFFNKYKFQVGAIQQGEKYRMFSSAFLHVDWTHFIFNMITLYFFGPVVIAFLGKVSFIIIYLVSIFLGSYFSLLVNKKNKYYSAVGASGAIVGVLYAAILMNPYSKIYLFFFLGLPAYLFGILYLGYSIYGMKKQNDNIGHSAHFGGAIGGYLSIVLLNFSSLLYHYEIALLLLIPILYFFYLVKKDIP